ILNHLLLLTHRSTPLTNYSVPIFILIVICPLSSLLFFFFNDPAPTEIYTLSLHDALPTSRSGQARSLPSAGRAPSRTPQRWTARSEEHTSELQSRFDLVCRLLLEKKKKRQKSPPTSITPSQHMLCIRDTTVA